MSRHMRTLVESELYSRCSAAIQPDAHRLDEALRFPLAAIAEHPERFPRIPGTKLRRVRTNQFPGAPALLLFFSIDNDDECTLWWLEKLPTPPEIGASITEDDEDGAEAAD